ncbi:hypothetical protein WAI453_002933 [Rhynchosporium graminicola]
MSILSNIAVGVLGAEHVYIMVLEMFMWTKPRGLKAFALQPDFAEKTKTLAANQGLDPLESDHAFSNLDGSHLIPSHPRSQIPGIHSDSNS